MNLVGATRIVPRIDRCEEIFTSFGEVVSKKLPKRVAWAGLWVGKLRNFHQEYWLGNGLLLNKSVVNPRPLPWKNGQPNPSKFQKTA